MTMALSAIHLPTGGQVIQLPHLPCLFTFSVTHLLLQPISLVKVRRGRVTSSEASPKTIHRRCVEMSTVRAVVSGGSSSVLLQEEVHALNKEERQKLLTDGGFGIEIPAEKGLAMKADLAIPWNKLRIIRRYDLYESKLVLYAIVHTYMNSSPVHMQVVEGLWSNDGK